MTEQFGNNASSTLTAAITNVQTTLVIAAIGRFPIVGNYRIAIDQELMIVTSVSGTTLTVTRGADGTTAASHAAGVQVNQVMSRESLRNHICDILDSIVCCQGTVVTSGGNVVYRRADL